MQSFLLLSFLAILTVESIRNLPFRKEISKLLSVAQKSSRILLSKRISDHWKERVLLRYAQAIFTSTLSLALLLSGLLVLITFGAFVLDTLFNPKPSILHALVTPTGWIWMTVAASAYFYAVNHVFGVSNGSDYSFGDRVLHNIALGSPWIGRISFDLDQALAKPKAGGKEQSPAFISGLARAGTTILMRTLYETGEFRSLTYRDMPFVLMPNMWKVLSTSFQKDQLAKERAHGDGIEVNFDSPEAFEEIFWRTFSADDYLFKDHLSPHVVSREVLEQFRQFVTQVVSSADKPKQQRYLSKNNNNILRLGSIRRAFPDALIIVPFRDPLQQAFSLLQQHTQFCAMHKRDKFSRDYMEWLGHHEFGGTHRPFHFPGRCIVNDQDYKPESINYWLALWINTYRYLLDSAPKDTVFVCFEELCLEPQKVMNSLFTMANFSADTFSIEGKFRAPAVRQVEDVDELLQKQAVQTYSDLSVKARELFAVSSV